MHSLSHIKLSHYLIRIEQITTNVITYAPIGNNALILTIFAKVKR